jgi:formylglycine-generating enzyme
MPTELPRPSSVSALALAAIIASAANANVFDMPAGLTSIEFVTVGNPGNPDDTHGSGFGGLDYRYQMGRFEITAGQYCQFLNAVAKADTHGLYNTSMSTSSWGCKILQGGSSGNYNYSVASDWADRPVNFVSWGDAARFCNWLTNGQPTGPQGLSTTEDGSYYLNGATDQWPLGQVTRKVNARYVIPTEDEWYKAAYHKNDGATGNYWDFPIGSDAIPGNDVVQPVDPGNNANYCIYPNDFAIGGPYYRTEVGEFENSASPYGTFDQGGNVWEWNEASSLDPTFGWYRGLRGGSAWSGSTSSQEVYWLSTRIRPDDAWEPVTSEQNYSGFRIVEIPEPASIMLLLTGSLLVAPSRFRRRPFFVDSVAGRSNAQ